MRGFLDSRKTVWMLHLAWGASDVSGFSRQSGRSNIGITFGKLRVSFRSMPFEQLQTAGLAEVFVFHPSALIASLGK